MDSNDKDRVGEAHDELHKLLSEHELREAALLVFANKQDLPNAMSVAEVTDKLALQSLRNRKWYIQSTCAMSGEGLLEGLNWLGWITTDNLTQTSDDEWQQAQAEWQQAKAKIAWCKKGAFAKTADEKLGIVMGDPDSDDEVILRLADGEESEDYIKADSLTQATASDEGYEALMKAQKEWQRASDEGYEALMSLPTKPNVAPSDDAVVSMTEDEMEAEREKILAQPKAFAPPLSCGKLTLGGGGATATKAWGGPPNWPAALVAVSRGGGAEGFAAAAVVQALPKDSGGPDFSFGVGRAMPKEGKTFGYGAYAHDGADGTCGLGHNPQNESGGSAGTKGFGQRADGGKHNHRLGPPGAGPRPVIKPGSRLALHLSARGPEGTRTARFFVDKEEVAVFVDIEDDGGDSDWVAGVTLTNRASVRLVPAEGEELIPFLTEAEKKAAAEKLAAEKAAAEKAASDDAVVSMTEHEMEAEREKILAQSIQDAEAAVDAHRTKLANQLEEEANDNGCALSAEGASLLASSELRRTGELLPGMSNGEMQRLGLGAADRAALAGSEHVSRGAGYLSDIPALVAQLEKHGCVLSEAAEGALLLFLQGGSEREGEQMLNALMASDEAGDPLEALEENVKGMLKLFRKGSLPLTDHAQVVTLMSSLHRYGAALKRSVSTLDDLDSDIVFILALARIHSAEQFEALNESAMAALGLGPDAVEELSSKREEWVQEKVQALLGGLGLGEGDVSAEGIRVLLAAQLTKQGAEELIASGVEAAAARGLNEADFAALSSAQDRGWSAQTEIAKKAGKKSDTQDRPKSGLEPRGKFMVNYYSAGAAEPHIASFYKAPSALRQLTEYRARELLGRWLGERLTEWQTGVHGKGATVALKSDGRRGVSTMAEASLAQQDWDRSKHGRGTKVKRKSDGRRGVSTMDRDSDGDINIKFDDDDSSVSEPIKTRDVWVVDGSLPPEKVDEAIQQLDLIPFGEAVLQCGFDPCLQLLKSLGIDARHSIAAASIPALLEAGCKDRDLVLALTVDAAGELPADVSAQVTDYAARELLTRCLEATSDPVGPTADSSSVPASASASASIVWEQLDLVPFGEAVQHCGFNPCRRLLESLGGGARPGISGATLRALIEAGCRSKLDLMRTFDVEGTIARDVRENWWLDSKVKQVARPSWESEAVQTAGNGTITVDGGQIKLSGGSGYSMVVCRVPFPDTGRHTVKVKVHSCERGGIGVVSSFEAAKAHTNGSKAWIGNGPNGWCLFTDGDCAHNGSWSGGSQRFSTGSNVAITVDMDRGTFSCKSGGRDLRSNVYRGLPKQLHFAVAMYESGRMEIDASECGQTQTSEPSGAWTVLPSAAECESELQAAKLRLILAFLHNDRLTENCPLLLDGGRNPETIAACFQVNGMRPSPDATVTPDIPQEQEQPQSGGLAALATSDSPERSGKCQRGVRFDVRSDGPAVRLTALIGGAYGGDRHVTIYSCEGPGTARQTERAAWREVGAGALTKDQSTRLALSSPVLVAAGATVGLCVHSTRDGVKYSKEGKPGEVDASDGVITVLKGQANVEADPFADGTGQGFALAGAVEYEQDTAPAMQQQLAFLLHGPAVTIGGEGTIATGDGTEESAVCPLFMRAGTHTARFTVRSRGPDDPLPRVGVVAGEDFVPSRGVWASKTSCGWLLSAISGKLMHDSNGSNWPGQPGRETVKAGDVIELVLDVDAGSLAVELNGRQLGLMVSSGLRPPLRWAVDVYKNSVEIDGVHEYQHSSLETELPAVVASASVLTQTTVLSTETFAALPEAASTEVLNLFVRCLSSSLGEENTVCEDTRRLLFLANCRTKTDVLGLNADIAATLPAKAATQLMQYLGREVLARWLGERLIEDAFDCLAFGEAVLHCGIDACVQLLESLGREAQRSIGGKGLMALLQADCKTKSNVLALSSEVLSTLESAASAEVADLFVRILRDDPGIPSVQILNIATLRPLASLGCTRLADVLELNARVVATLPASAVAQTTNYVGWELLKLWLGLGDRSEGQLEIVLQHVNPASFGEAVLQCGFRSCAELLESLGRDARHSIGGSTVRALLEAGCMTKAAVDTDALAALPEAASAEVTDFFARALCDSLGNDSKQILTDKTLRLLVVANCRTKSDVLALNAEIAATLPAKAATQIMQYLGRELLSRWLGESLVELTQWLGERLIEEARDPVPFGEAALHCGIDACVRLLESLGLEAHHSIGGLTVKTLLQAECKTKSDVLKLSPKVLSSLEGLASAEVIEFYFHLLRDSLSSLEHILSDETLRALAAAGCTSKGDVLALTEETFVALPKAASTEAMVFVLRCSLGGSEDVTHSSGRLSFTRAHHNIALSADGARATGNGSLATAVSGSAMRGGRHSAKFTLSDDVKASTCVFGVIGLGFDVEGADRPFNVTGEHEGCFYFPDKGSLYPGGTDWDGMQTARAGDTIEMVLDLEEGSMTVHKNDKRLGVMQKGGLTGAYCWAVCIATGTVHIAGKPIVGMEQILSDKTLRVLVTDAGCRAKHDVVWLSPAAIATLPHDIGQAVQRYAELEQLTQLEALRESLYASAKEEQTAAALDLSTAEPVAFGSDSGRKLEACSSGIVAVMASFGSDGDSDQTLGLVRAGETGTSYGTGRDNGWCIKRSEREARLSGKRGAKESKRAPDAWRLGGDGRHSEVTMLFDRDKREASFWRGFTVEGEPATVISNLPDEDLAPFVGKYQNRVVVKQLRWSGVSDSGAKDSGQRFTWDPQCLQTCSGATLEDDNKTFKGDNEYKPMLATAEFSAGRHSWTVRGTQWTHAQTGIAAREVDRSRCPGQDSTARVFGQDSQKHDFQKSIPGLTDAAVLTLTLDCDAGTFAVAVDGVPKPGLTFSDGIAGKTWIPVVGCASGDSSVTIEASTDLVSEETLRALAGEGCRSKDDVDALSADKIATLAVAAAAEVMRLSLGPGSEAMSDASLHALADAGCRTKEEVLVLDVSATAAFATEASSQVTEYMARELLKTWLGERLTEWQTGVHGTGAAVVLKSDGRRGVSTVADSLAQQDWDRSKHGRGTKVKRKSDGRRGVSTMDRDSDGDIKIKFDDDGSTSSYVKTRDVWALAARTGVEIKIRFDDDSSVSEPIKTRDVWVVDGALPPAEFEKAIQQLDLIPFGEAVLQCGFDPCLQLLKSLGIDARQYVSGVALSALIEAGCKDKDGVLGLSKAQVATLPEVAVPPVTQFSLRCSLGAGAEQTLSNEALRALATDAGCWAKHDVVWLSEDAMMPLPDEVARAVRRYAELEQPKQLEALRESLEARSEEEQAFDRLSGSPELLFGSDTGSIVDFSSEEDGGRKVRNVQTGSGDGWVAASSGKEQVTVSFKEGKPALVTHLMLKNYASKRFAVQFLEKGEWEFLLTWRDAKSGPSRVSNDETTRVDVRNVVTTQLRLLLDQGSCTSWRQFNAYGSAVKIGGISAGQDLAWDDIGDDTLRALAAAGCSNKDDVLGLGADARSLLPQAAADEVVDYYARLLKASLGEPTGAGEATTVECEEQPEPEPEPRFVAQPTVFAPQLSHEKLTLSNGGATATKRWNDWPYYP
eukprot:COSAG04_NODE_200_length_20490_cov_33.582021_1_plen_3559_part_10